MKKKMDMEKNIIHMANWSMKVFLVKIKEMEKENNICVIINFWRKIFKL